MKSSLGVICILTLHSYLLLGLGSFSFLRISLAGSLGTTMDDLHLLTSIIEG